jgi:hypothetical protein
VALIVGHEDAGTPNGLGCCCQLERGAMIIALVGRRIGQPGDVAALFPDSNTERVRQRLKALFHEVGATCLVSSGACGADLLAMEVARELCLKRRMILPFDRDRFVESSVIDRGYARDWGTVFQTIADEIDADNGLIILRNAGVGHAAYRTVNSEILDEAERMAREGQSGALAVVVWNGKPRQSVDLTKAFVDEARARSLPVREVLTIDAAHTG